MTNSNKILKQMRERCLKEMEETRKINEKILKIPENLSEEEKKAYEEIVKGLKEVEYRLCSSDVELIWQYCQTKVMRDRSWREYSENPTRYIKIVTGICSDGQTPKIAVKENEHYKTLIDCNKQLEKILKDLRLTPDSRKK